MILIPKKIMKIILRPSDLITRDENKNIEELTLSDFRCFTAEPFSMRFADMADEITYIDNNKLVYLKSRNYLLFLNKIYKQY